MKLYRQFRSGTLTGSICIGIEGNEDPPAGILTELGELLGGQMTPETAGSIAKAGLP
jgi:hypothetical protein